ncbi:hypothetical protein MNBD_GAMMA17-2036 [hydrothermal vent metagenome]|uniref:Uncharacterized protein n=1 Tax=hydrothermal vent metagenome TaxID=652676 RepID=A0A3B1A885_9ZZZZ
MRYASLIFAYAIVALLLGLGFLFPERPLTLMGFLMVTAAFTPVVAGFDLVGQGILDSPWIKSAHQLVKPLLGLMVLAAFLATLYTVVNMIDVATKPWW